MEGDAIIEAIEFNGNVIKLKVDSTRDKFSANPKIEEFIYNDIVSEESYNDHYNQTIVDFILKKDGDDKGKRILRIMKDV
jgi:hypothetical protein